MAKVHQTYTCVVGPGEGKRRLDVYLDQQGVKRSLVGAASTVIELNGKPAKKGKSVKEGDRITISYTEISFTSLTAQDIPLDVIYEDEHILVLNKEQGMVVHPGAGTYENTVVNALLERYGIDFASLFSEKDDEEEEQEPNLLLSPSVRAGIVHRLDKDTSGTMVIARTPTSLATLSAQFKERTTTKTYIALAKGTFSKVEGSISHHIKRDSKNRKRFVTCGTEEGRDALTHYQVLRQFTHYALLRITLITGRTHQIRVHLASLGHPLIGDVLYGKEDGTTLMLHALELGFDHPESGERLSFRSALPQRFLQYVQSC